MSSLLGSLAVVGSAASAGLANVVAKGHAEAIDPAANVLVQSATGALILSCFGIATESNSTLNFSFAALASILYLGVVGSALAFVGLYWLLKKITATNSSIDYLRGFSISSFMILLMSLLGDGVSVGVRDL
jgi:drug/metabolite transporter (DMT)-like permease